MGTRHEDEKGEKVVEEVMTCYACEGKMEQRKTTFTADYKGCVYIVKGVPSYVCTQCGEIVYDNDTMGRLEEIVNDMKKAASEVSMTTYNAA